MDLRRVLNEMDGYAFEQTSIRIINLRLAIN